MKTSNNPDTDSMQTETSHSDDTLNPTQNSTVPGTTQENETEMTNNSTDYGTDLADEETLARLKGEIAQLRDTLLRRTAEFDNIKKRMLRERLQLLDDARFEALKSFLPVNDDLQRTLEAARDTEIPASFLEGIVMVAEKFSSILTSNGVEAIDKTGVPFDVNLHDALMRQPAPDGKTPSDTVLQILETGYKAGDKIIRHAKVIVSE
jgi:molecular chaperone GrpE